MLFRYVKRGFDLFSSSLALIVLSPIFIFICLGIKISSRGPVLYTTQRVGLKGRPFTVYKFRSMHIRKEGTVESKYLVNNKRIFKFGSFLRKSKLDELPQLINVFLGDMSVIGPRPYPKSVVRRLYSGDYSVLSVRPGLACLDSLYDYAHGELFVSDEKEYAEKILPVRTELARMYVRNKSVALDIYCILRTISLIFKIIVLKKKKFDYNKYELKAISKIQTNILVIED